MSENTQGYALEWDSEIENDGPGFMLLPEGDYDFEIVKFERERYSGGDKLPACNKAVVHIKIETSEGQNIIRHNLFLHTKTEGMLCAFFTAIGQRSKGEKLKMNWNAVTGAKGRCKVGVRKWTGDDGDERSSNEIKKFYEAQPMPPAKSFEDDDI